MYSLGSSSASISRKMSSCPGGAASLARALGHRPALKQSEHRCQCGGHPSIEAAQSRQARSIVVAMIVIVAIVAVIVGADPLEDPVRGWRRARLILEQGAALIPEQRRGLA